MEDDHSEAITPKNNSCWSFFTIFDGHNGWETSAYLRETMIKAVSEELSKADADVHPNATSDPYSEAIIRAFKRLDDDIVHGAIERTLEVNSRTAAVNILAPAYAGACALLAFYDAKLSSLWVALTGDCRALLGRKRSDGKYDLEVLTVDQNAFDPAEKARVEAEHPGEDVVKDGRTMGFAPSRVFGDARYKWSRDVQTRLKKEFLGRSVLEHVKTPPYFTAEPVVTRADGIKEGDFIILASDGLGECLTNPEAIGLVGKWREMVDPPAGYQLWRNLWQAFSNDDSSLPVVVSPPDELKAKHDGRRHQQWVASKMFTTVDENVATHLIRNSLGGSDKDLLEALLSLESPSSRSYR